MSPAPISRRTVLGAGTALGMAGILATVEARIPVSDPDAELFDLIARHAEAEVAVERADLASGEAFGAFLSAVPPRPGALRWREDDFPRTALGLGLSDRGEGEERWYRERAVAWMRDRPAAEWFRSLVPALGSVCEARRAEILEAWDSYQAVRREAEVATGYAAATEALDAAASLVVDLACKVKRCRPRTLSGLRALGAWFGRQEEAGTAHDDALALLAAAVAGFGGAA